MGSIEIYDFKQRQWIPYVLDHQKWQQHFVDVSEGRVHPYHRGRYIVGSGARWRKTSHMESPKVELVTPVAQAIEMAKSELKREGQKVIRGKTRRVDLLTINWKNESNRGESRGRAFHF